MAEVNELDGADKFIWDRLTGQAGMAALVQTPGGEWKVFSELAPREIAGEEVTTPYIVFSFLVGPDNLAIGRARIFTRPVYLVRAVTEGTSLVQAAAIADLIDLALHNAPPAVPIAGLQVMGSDRVQPIRFIEVTDGVRYNHVGGQYRLFVHDLN